MFTKEEKCKREKEIKEISKNNCFIEFILDTPYIDTEEKQIFTFSKDITENELDEIFNESVKENANYYYDFGFYNDYDEQEYEEYIENCFEYSSYRELFVEYEDDLEYLIKNFIE